MPFKSTKQQRLTGEMKERMEASLREDYDHFFNENIWEKPALHFMVEMSPMEMWWYEIEKKISDDGEENEQVYMLWNGSEIISYDDADTAYCDMIVDLRTNSLNEQWKFYASPLIISGALAFGMLFILGFLTIGKFYVPDQLWTIFAAVTAFYFGKEGWTAMRSKSDD